MKKKILLALFILNTLIIFIYFIPLLQDIAYVLFDTDAGIIGGADGPTAIFITSRISWLPILLFSIEIILGLVLLISRPKK